MKFINHKQKRIHPEDGQEIRNIAEKWGISMRQLNEAIVDTGSIDLDDLKRYLKGKGLVQFSFSRWIHSIFDTTGLTRFTKA